MDGTCDRLLRLLDDGHATYRLIEHESEGRTEAVSILRGNPLEQAAKCIVLIVKFGKKVTHHVLAVVPGDQRVDLTAVKQLLGATYVAFADPASAESLAGSVAGTVLPFSFSPDLELIVDPDLMDADTLFFKAARLDRSIALDRADYARLARPRLERIAEPHRLAQAETRTDGRQDSAAGVTSNIEMAPAYDQATVIDVVGEAASHPVGWTNRTLNRVNDALVRLGVFEGEFPWHAHTDEDEFFLVLEGRIYLDIEGREPAVLGHHCAFTVPKGVRHRPRAPERAVVLMIESASVTPTGD